MLKRVQPPAQYTQGDSVRTDDGLFRPGPQGRTAAALETLGQLSVVAPSSPRPAEMLEGVVIDKGAAALTADDSALHELLVSVAYEEDRAMPSGTVHSVPMSHVLHYLGPNTRRDSVKDSMRRLMSTTVSYGTKSKRRYEQVPLLTSWTETTESEDVVSFTLPEPICALMRSQPRYAYIELAALSAMRCRYSSRLYRVLALEAAKTKWEPGANNTAVVSVTPSDLADWVGFPTGPDGTVAYGKMKERLIAFLHDQEKESGKTVPGDLAAVRRFSTHVREVRKPGRGREVERVEFVLTLRPPSYHMVRTCFSPKSERVRIGGPDAERYRVNSHIWRRGEKAFARVLGQTHDMMFETWTVALNEALTCVPVSHGYHGREFRGAKLLEAIDMHGADYAAWGFLTEEAERPDLSVMSGLDEDGQKRLRERERAAEAARRERLAGEHKSKAKAPALAPASVPARKQDAADSPAAQDAGRVTFESCSKVVFPLDEAVNVYDVDGIGARIQRVTWNGSRMVSLVLRFWDRGTWDEWTVGRYPVSEQNLDEVLKGIGRAIDGVEEYAA